jgi:hypothetical protein
VGNEPFANRLHSGDVDNKVLVLGEILQFSRTTRAAVKRDIDGAKNLIIGGRLLEAGLMARRPARFLMFFWRYALVSRLPKRSSLLLALALGLL